MSVVDQSSSTASSRRLPLTFKLSPKLINGLANRQLPFSMSQSEISGLLYGLVEQSSIVVQAFSPFQAGKTVSGFRDRTEQNQILQQHLTVFSKDAETSALQLLGWYTLRQQGGLTGSDLTYHNWFFPRPSDLALIIRPDGASDFMLELFCRATTGILSEEARRIGLARLSGIPVDQPVEVVLGTNVQDLLFMRAYEEESEEAQAPGSSWKSGLLERSRRTLSFFQPGKRHSQQPLPGQALATQGSELSKTGDTHGLSRPSPTTRTAVSAPSLPKTPVSPSLISAPAEPRGRRTRPPWIAVLLVFIAASAVSFGGIYYLRTMERNDSWPRFFRSDPTASTLGLRLDAQGDRLLLSWNRQDPLVRQASNGFLQIVDGLVRRQVILDRSQVANGSILYHPTSDDISFQLEVRAADGRHEAESMRVLEAAKLPILDVSPQKTGVREPVIDVPTTEGNGLLPKASVGQRRDGPVSQKPTLLRPAEVGGASPVTKPAVPPAESANLPARVAAPEEEFHGVPEDVPEPRETATPVPKLETIVPAKLEPVNPPKVEPANLAKLAAAVQKPQPTPLLPAQKALVTLSSYQPPRPVRQVLPVISLLPPGTLAAAGQVEVLVKINAIGKVTGAQVLPHGRTLSAALIGSALAAAKAWQFAPAVLNAKPVESEHSIVFQFSKAQ